MSNSEVWWTFWTLAIYIINFSWGITAEFNGFIQSLTNIVFLSASDLEAVSPQHPLDFVVLNHALRSDTEFYLEWIRPATLQKRLSHSSSTVQINTLYWCFSFFLDFRFELSMSHTSYRSIWYPTPSPDPCNYDIVVSTNSNLDSELCPGPST